MLNYRLRMIWVDSQIGEKERLATWFVTASIGLHCYKYRVDLSERFRVVALQNPAFFGSAVLVENSQINRLFLFRSAPAPSLKSTGTLHFGLAIQIVGVKDEGFAFCIKHTPIRLLCLATPRHVIDFGDI